MAGAYMSLSEGLLIEAEMTEDSCITKVQPITVNSSQKLASWSTLQDLQAVQQLREHLFQAGQLV